MKYLSLLFLLVPFSLFAQNDTTHSNTLKTLSSFIKASTWEFQNRNVFMATINDGELKDDYALGTSVSVGFTTPSFKGFQIGLSGSFIFNIASSDLAKPDPTTMNIDRYETGLFNLENLSQRSDMNKLEKAFIRYNISATSAVSFGRIGLNTPFINPQDGRLRPTAQQGLWIDINEMKHFKFSGGFISAISPRSEVGWYSVSESFGLYPSGVGIDGKRSDYRDNISTKGIGLLNVIYTHSPRFKVSLWNTMIENVMNTAMVELSGQTKIGNNDFYQGLMFIRQDAINDGGNINPAKTYISKGGKANIVSAQLGYKTKQFNTSLNYTRITNDGRFLSPREWGRDPFYTFMPRERNEGFGDVNAIMTKCAYNSNSGKFRTSLAYGYYHLPDVKDFFLNKYGQPSYHQINLETGYAFQGIFKGLDFRTLFAYKINAGNSYDNPKYVYNKVNMINCNVILEYKL